MNKKNRKIIKDLIETYLKSFKEYISNFLHDRTKDQVRFYSNLWLYKPSIENLIQYAHKTHIEIGSLDGQYEEQKKLLEQTITKMGKAKFWQAVKKDLEFNFKILLGTHPRGFSSLSLDKDELATILYRRTTAEFVIHCFPKEYGNFDDKKEALAIWDNELRERADMLRYDEEYKSYYMGPFWLPKEQYWWNFIWDVECE